MDDVLAWMIMLLFLGFGSYCLYIMLNGEE